MICPNCNSPVRENADFCGRCGFRLKKPATEPTKICPSCGTTIKAQNEFCTECGYNFNGFSSNRRQETNQQEEWENGRERKRRSGDKGKKKSIVPVVLISIFGIVCVLCMIVFLLSFFKIIEIPFNLPFGQTESATEISTEKKVSDGDEDDTDEEDDVISGLTTGEKPDTSDQSSDMDNDSNDIGGNSNVIVMDGVGVDEKTYPTKVSDFIEYSDPSGVYSFVYPRNFFETGVYDEDRNLYEFKTTNQNQILTIQEEDAPVKNNPKQAAIQKAEESKTLFNLTSNEMFTWESPAVSDTGYFREIVTGPDKNNGRLGRYILHAATSDKVYTLSYTYLKETNDEATEMSLNGYLIESLYRGWSISGASSGLRDYDSYKNNDSEKKE